MQTKERVMNSVVYVNGLKTCAKCKGRSFINGVCAKCDAKLANKRTEPTLLDHALASLNK